MYKLQVTVTKVLGECTAHPPMKRGDYFTVRNGDIRIPNGGYICMWALQNLLPVIPSKERKILEEKSDDWMWRVHHVQCPDPKGRALFKIERMGEIGIKSEEAEREAAHPVEGRRSHSVKGATDGLRNLRVVVEEVRGKCTSGMRPGDYFTLCDGRIYIPAHRHFCLYALQATLPLLPAKQRRLDDGDWLKEENHVICPDPAGNVIMRIEECA